MEGPSLALAAKQLKPFVKKIILEVSGNTKIGKERLHNKKILAIFSWGKHLVFQFDLFALRVHFMLFGSFEAAVNGKMVTGDYPKKGRQPRLRMDFENGSIDLFSCSLRYIECSHAKSLYDFSIDIMSKFWDGEKALKRLKSDPESQIADLLLDQTLFAGVGNIIKNEVLFLTKTLPTTLVKNLSEDKLEKIVTTVKKYSKQFYNWRKHFVLKKHYLIYRKGYCPICSEKVVRKKTGIRQRISFFCPHCQN